MTTGSDSNYGRHPPPTRANSQPPSWAVFFEQFSPGIRIGIILGAIFYLACFAIAFKLDRWWLNILLCLSGGVLGWFVGILGSPTSRVESDAFGEYRRALSAFISGFLLARLDVLISQFNLEKVGDPYLFVARALLFATTFFLSVQFTFMTRLTGRKKGSSLKPPVSHQGKAAARG